MKVRLVVIIRKVFKGRKEIMKESGINKKVLGKGRMLSTDDDQELAAVLLRVLWRPKKLRDLDFDLTDFALLVLRLSSSSSSSYFAL